MGGYTYAHIEQFAQVGGRTQIMVIMLVLKGLVVTDYMVTIITEIELVCTAQLWLGYPNYKNLN